MNTLIRLALGLLVLTVVAAAGCMNSSTPSEEPRVAYTPPVYTPPVIEEGKKTLFAKNIFFETLGDRRRVLLSAYVVRREGALELFLCRSHSKEHESILAADVDPLKVHEALIAAKAKAGSTVRYEPQYRPPEGDKIKVTLQWESNGRRLTASGQSWVRNAKTHKEMTNDWVFAGSQLVPNPLDPKQPPSYLAAQPGEGTLICLSNFESAVLDVPIQSAHDWANLEFEPFTEHIPPLETKVSVILELVGK